MHNSNFKGLPVLCLYSVILAHLANVIENILSGTEFVHS